MKKNSLLLVLTVSLSVQAHAATSFVSSRSALGGDDYIDWATAGANQTLLPSSFNISSFGGMSVDVSKSTVTPFERRDQGYGWAGNFAPGDALLWVGYNYPGTMIFDFNSGVLGAGAQVQADFYGSFSGTIAAYDGSSSLLGSYSFYGNSNGNGDNSAVFAGISSSTPIFRLTITAFNYYEDFAINRLDLVTAQSTPDIGTTMPLVGLALVGLGLFRRSLKA